MNQQFEPQFARFASAARELSAPHSPFGTPSPLTAATRLSAAALGLMGVLAPKLQGNTLLVAERLTRQLQLTIDALNHPGLTALFMGRTAWDVVRGVLGQDTPDLQAQVNRAQTGMRILAWTASHLSPLQSQDSEAVLAAARAEPQLAQWAEIWLSASGLPQQNAGQSGYGGYGHPAPHKEGYGQTTPQHGGYGQPAPYFGGHHTPRPGAYGGNSPSPTSGWPG